MAVAPGGEGIAAEAVNEEHVGFPCRMSTAGDLVQFAHLIRRSSDRAVGGGCPKPLPLTSGIGRTGRRIRAASSSVERWPVSQVSILRGVGSHPDRRIMTDAWPECNSAIQLSALLGNASTANVDRVETELAELLIPGAKLRHASTLFRDLIVFTHLRLVLVDQQSLTGAERESPSVPHRSIDFFTKEGPDGAALSCRRTHVAFRCNDRCFQKPHSANACTRQRKRAWNFPWCCSTLGPSYGSSQSLRGSNGSRAKAF